MLVIESNFNLNLTVFIIGPYNLSGEWKGALGDVVTGKYSFSLSSWVMTKERKEVADRR